MLDSISGGENSFSDCFCSDFLYQPDSPVIHHIYVEDIFDVAKG